QDKILQMRPYAQKLSISMQNVSALLGEGVENPFAEEREPESVLLVVVSSDRGLCGAFNSSIFKYARARIDEAYAAQEKSGNLTILPVGKRSFEYFKKRNYNLEDQYYEMFGHLSFDAAREAAQHIMDAFGEGVYDRVEVIFNEFKNVATQIIRCEQFLPIPNNESEEEQKAGDTDYIYEPSQEEVFTNIIPNSLKIQLYKALLESNASEHGARMTAMDQATDNAGELLKDLRLTYNRTRQAAITKEILEIVGGAEALSQGA
ncbi:MAG: ATP synthase F1 subunit gamma, partial [Cyclobacteriaceae bacterium]|nr:ATP synthase F1 subunit gamma [Cyclobacteriaceae bacterium HetDA_MAG_MS6]